MRFVKYGVAVVLLVGAVAGLPPDAHAQFPDADEDGIGDEVDNCTVVANSGQLDSDCDGYGNACDADFGGNGLVDLADYFNFIEPVFAIFGAGSHPIFDVAPPFGVVDAADVNKVWTNQGTLPGPSAYEAFLNPAPYCPGQNDVRYCIEGVGTGTSYSWRLSGGPPPGLPFTETNVTPVPAGSNANMLMLGLVASIDSKSLGTGVHVRKIEFGVGDPVLITTPCFWLSNAGVTLKVGDADGQNMCTVTNNSSCTYNPTISKVGTEGPTGWPTPVPALPRAAVLALFLLFGVGGFFVLRRLQATRA